MCGCRATKTWGARDGGAELRGASKQSIHTSHTTGAGGNERCARGQRRGASGMHTCMARVENAEGMVSPEYSVSREEPVGSGTCACTYAPNVSPYPRSRFTKRLVDSRSDSCFGRPPEALLKVRACSKQAARLASIYRTSHKCRSRCSHMLAATRRRQRWQQEEEAMQVHPRGGDDFGPFCVGQRR
jgi:hypothetical protein